MSSSIELARQYSSFSGVDIRVAVAGKIIGEMQAISYAVQREKAPIYVMGRVDPISFSRGKRGIAGTMISLLLDSHILNKDPAKGGFQDGHGLKRKYIGDVQDSYPSTLTTAFSGENNADGEGLDADISATVDLKDLFAAAIPHYVDQILPFDVTIMAANEIGQASAMRVYGCEILNEGSGFSIDDIVIESQMTYVCRTILPWKKLGSWSVGGAGGAEPAWTDHGVAP